MVITHRYAINGFEKVIPVSVMSHAFTAEFFHLKIHATLISRK